MSDGPAFWFSVKRYGWGWGLPVRWQGWVVLVSYVALVTAASYYFNALRGVITFAACILALTACLRRYRRDQGRTTGPMALGRELKNATQACALSRGSAFPSSFSSERQPKRGGSAAGEV